MVTKTMENTWRLSYVFLGVMGIITIVLVAFSFITQQLMSLFLMINYVLGGLVYVILAYFIRKRKLAASIIAMILIVVDMSSTYFFYHRFSIVKLLLLLVLFLGAEYLWKSK